MNVCYLGCQVCRVEIGVLVAVEVGLFEGLLDRIIGRTS